MKLAIHLWHEKEGMSVGESEVGEGGRSGGMVCLIQYVSQVGGKTI